MKGWKAGYRLQNDYAGDIEYLYLEKYRTEKDKCCFLQRLEGDKMMNKDPCVLEG